MAQLKVKPRLCLLGSESRELELNSMQGTGSPLAKEASFRTLLNMEPQNVKVDVNNCLRSLSHAASLCEAHTHARTRMHAHTQGSATQF